MDDEQIKHMVIRFLAWRLPMTFNPDGGVRFEREVNGIPRPEAWWPVGTNLFNAYEAEAMVRHMVEGVEFAPSVYDTATAPDDPGEVLDMIVAVLRHYLPPDDEEEAAEIEAIARHILEAVAMQVMHKARTRIKEAGG